jgi:hypothetical protein
MQFGEVGALLANEVADTDAAATAMTTVKIGTSLGLYMVRTPG